MVLLILCVGPGASSARAQSADAVGAWGDNDSGQTTVPIAAWSGLTAIAAGAHHTVALKNDGSVVAWGDSGQMDVPIAAQSGVTAVAAGGAYTVALKSNGTVVAWGRNVFGQTTAPAALSGVTAIAAGYRHTVALKNDGSVVAWGFNSEGQVTGTPTTNAPYSATASPVTLGGQVLSGVTAIAAGVDHTVALKNDGSVVAWGSNRSGQTAAPAGLSGITAIAAGGQHTVALKNDGSVVAWGDNEYGQTSVPVAARGGVMAIAAGYAHTVALKQDGSVVAWGYNLWGQVTGTSTTEFPFFATASPVTLGSQVLSGVRAIAAGAYHTVALVTPLVPVITTQPSSQVVNEWRNGSFSVVAAGFPLKYQWRKDGVDIAGATSATYSLTRTQTNQAGNYSVVVSSPAGSVISAPAAVLTVNPVAPGSVVAWGPDWAVPTDVPVEVQSGVTAIAAGYSHTVALKSDGSVVAWGDNNSGQTAAPVAAQSGVTAIAAGDLHTVALKSDGSVVAWGYNAEGQVTGTSPTGEPYSSIANPVTLGGQVVSGVKAIAAGGLHTVVLKNDGTVVAWGSNLRGQVTGTPSTDDSSSATAIPVTLGGHVLSGVTAIAAARYFTVALKSDGSVVAWGNNEDGQPMAPVPAQSGVTAIAAAGECTTFGCGGHIVALKNDGSVLVWGDSGLMDVPVAAQSGVTAIATGRYHIVALKNDGSVVAWGRFNETTVPAGLKGVTAIAAGGNQTVALLGTVLLLPSLNATSNANELILSWPTNVVGFTLQSTLNLTPPVTWLDSTNAPVLMGTRLTVTQSASYSSQFYRLRKP